MVAIGKISPEKKKLMDTAHECLMRSIKILKPGVLIHEIGDIIEDYAGSQGFSVVNQFVGHGVGLQFHESPQIPHHLNDLKIPLTAGMTFTIEPMINGGKKEGYIDSNDGWTARTCDGHPSAQAEHTILITETGHEILTLYAQ
jgi:methionyl aminopeptidase